MQDSTYRVIAMLLKILVWRGQLMGAENLPKRGPAVFVSNHLDALGPIACVSQIPLRLYPWVQGKMLSEQESADYLRVDFVEKTLHLRPPLSFRAARGLSAIVLPLLRSVGSIPVYRGNELSRKHITWDESLKWLIAGQCLLVFPEDPDGPADPVTGVRPFMHGVLWLSDVYYHATGDALPFYLVAVHPSRRMQVNPPVALSPLHFAATDGKQYWLDLFEHTIKEMLVRMSVVTQGKLD